IFITHDMGVVAELADRTVVMFQGHVVEENTTNAIFANPVHPYTRRLLSAVPTLGSMKGTSAPEPFVILDSAGQPVAPAEAKERAGTAAGVRPLLQVSNLVKRFPIRKGAFARLTGHVHAVENVSFSLEAGETLSLVGESGC